MARHIDENLLIEKMTRLRGCSCSYSDGIIDEVEDIMSDLPTANVISIPDNATNGDMIQAMFPNVQIVNVGIHRITVIFGDCHNMMYRNSYDEDWWNALYKKEVEE